MTTGNGDESYIRSLEASIVGNRPLEQRIAYERGLDVQFLTATIDVVWGTLKDTDMFKPLEEIAESFGKITTHQWFVFAKAEKLSAVRCVRFGGYGKYPHVGWVPTLRLDKFSSVIVEETVAVEVFLTVAGTWIVYRGPNKDNPDAAFMRRFATSGELCDFLRTLTLGEYSFQVPSPALALADRLMAFVKEYHEQLVRQGDKVASLIEARQEARNRFGDWELPF